MGSCKIRVKGIKGTSRNKAENSFFCQISKSASHALCKSTADQAIHAIEVPIAIAKNHYRIGRAISTSIPATPVSLNPQLKFADRPVPRLPPFLRIALLLHHAPEEHVPDDEAADNEEYLGARVCRREFLMIEPPREEPITGHHGRHPTD
ncbi:hypothetical protein K0M31_014303 [Melipona bicolor]|uniref:Uncharacterized protein n=1 Tax=Melipona bicolor TaxID=60889 RepID=A0AA40G901_9HYME|nr:hypothetical protein K0M31_014303 [Melipona bicolor]